MQNCNCDRTAVPWNPSTYLEEDCAENAWRFARRNAGIAEAASGAGGPEPWEAKSSLRTRTSYDRPGVYTTGLFRL